MGGKEQVPFGGLTYTACSCLECCREVPLQHTASIRHSAAWEPTSARTTSCRLARLPHSVCPPTGPGNWPWQLVLATGPGHSDCSEACIGLQMLALNCGALLNSNKHTLLSFLSSVSVRSDNKSAPSTTCTHNGTRTMSHCLTTSGAHIP